MAVLEWTSLVRQWLVCSGGESLWLLPCAVPDVTNRYDLLGVNYAEVNDVWLDWK